MDLRLHKIGIVLAFSLATACAHQPKDEVPQVPLAEETTPAQFPKIPEPVASPNEQAYKAISKKKKSTKKSKKVSQKNKLKKNAKHTSAMKKKQKPSVATAGTVSQFTPPPPPPAPPTSVSTRDIISPLPVVAASSHGSWNIIAALACALAILGAGAFGLKGRKTKKRKSKNRLVYR